MFREMRRADRLLTAEETEAILKENDWGILAVHGDDGYPYGVPLNYGYIDGKIYLHGTAEKSHKTDAIKNDDKVCFTVVNRHDMQAERFTTLFSSVIVFGRAKVISEPEALRKAMVQMMTGLAPEMASQAEEHCRTSIQNMVMIEITPEHMTAKARKS